MTLFVILSLYGCNRRDSSYEDPFVCYDKKKDVTKGIRNMISDSLVLNLFNHGQYDSIISLDSARLSSKGRVLYSIALIEKDEQEFEDNLNTLIPHICNISALVKYQRENGWLDRNLRDLNIYEKYLMYLYLEKNMIASDYLDHKFSYWFENENVDNNPIIKNEELYLNSLRSSQVEFDIHAVTHLLYNDSIIDIYSNNKRLYILLIDQYDRLGDKIKKEYTLNNLLQHTNDTLLFKHLSEVY